MDDTYHKDTGEFVITCPFCSCKLKKLSKEVFNYFKDYADDSTVSVKSVVVVCSECGKTFSYNL